MKGLPVDDKQLQAALKQKGFYTGAIDGDIGAKSREAIDAFLATNAIGFRKWGNDRRLLAAKQMIARLAGIDAGIVDGLMGPQTRQALELYAKGITEETWRDNEATESEIQKIDLAKPVWPRQADVEKVYGAPGKHLTPLVLPFPLRIAWDRTKLVKTFSIHEKVHDSAKRVFERVGNAYDDATRKRLGLDLFGGCFNDRTMRGGTKKSMHAYGIAIDFDPERNQLKWGRDKARLAQGDCDTFWRLWEEEGWLSLGRARNFDWMHVQAARL